MAIGKWGKTRRLQRIAGASQPKLSKRKCFTWVLWEQVLNHPAHPKSLFARRDMAIRPNVRPVQKALSEREQKLPAARQGPRPAAENRPDPGSIARLDSPEARPHTSANHSPFPACPTMSG